jgi:hypothetical protein
LVNIDEFDSYLDDIRSRLLADGYSQWAGSHPEMDEAAVFHRRKAEFSKLSLVDSFYAVKHQEQVHPNDFVTFSEAVIGMALEHKSWAPRGFGGIAVGHAVMVTTKPGPDLVEMATTYVPKHWAATEFPVLVDLGQRKLHHYGGTQLWGAAYYRGFRMAVEKLLTPR